MKPGSYTQLYIQIVIAVKYRKGLLSGSIRPRVFEYMSGIIRDLKHKSIIVNGVSDHVHILLGLNPSLSLSDTVHDIKRSTSLFINSNNFMVDKFAWQEGYGAFSYSKSQLDNVYRYILNQESHHMETYFSEEYIKLLEEFDIKYNSEYLFDFLDLP